MQGDWILFSLIMILALNIYENKATEIKQTISLHSKWTDVSRNPVKPAYTSILVCVGVILPVPGTVKGDTNVGSQEICLTVSKPNFKNQFQHILNINNILFMLITLYQVSSLSFYCIDWLEMV